jgi:hypothetical protein
MGFKFTLITYCKGKGALFIVSGDLDPLAVGADGSLCKACHVDS